MPRGMFPAATPSSPPSGLPHVLGPGQGQLPLVPGGDDFYGPIGTGMRGQGPNLDPSITPFEQTGYDLQNLWEHGTTVPHWSDNQMRKLFDVPLRKAIFNRDETRRAITASEVHRMLGNIGTGLGDYAGQLIPSMFGTGDAQYSAPPAIDPYTGVPPFTPDQFEAARREQQRMQRERRHQLNLERYRQRVPMR